MLDYSTLPGVCQHQPGILNRCEAFPRLIVAPVFSVCCSAPDGVEREDFLPLAVRVLLFWSANFRFARDGVCSRCLQGDLGLVFCGSQNIYWLWKH